MKKINDSICWAENCTCAPLEHIKITNLLTVYCQDSLFKGKYSTSWVLPHLAGRAVKNFLSPSAFES